MEFEVVMATNINGMVFWDVMMCSASVAEEPAASAFMVEEQRVHVPGCTV
jgi:hypothetical protein